MPNVLAVKSCEGRKLAAEVKEAWTFLLQTVDKNGSCSVANLKEMVFEYYKLRYVVIGILSLLD